jgi:cbb3-type cytochrome oxidase maturation protein
LNILFLLIPLGLLLLGIAVWAFFWAVGSGQFDDLHSPAWSVVMDDDRKPQSDDDKPQDDDAP